MQRTIVYVPYGGQSVRNIKAIVDRILEESGFYYELVNNEYMWVHRRENEQALSCVICLYGDKDLMLLGSVYDLDLKLEIDLTHTYLYRYHTKKAKQILKKINKKVRNYIFRERIKEKYKIGEKGTDIPKAETLAAIKEMDDIIAGKIPAKRYSSVDELINELDVQ